MILSLFSYIFRLEKLAHAVLDVDADKPEPSLREVDELIELGTLKRARFRVGQLVLEMHCMIDV